MRECVDNCYEKHTKAFDLYMDVNYFKNRNKKLPEYIELEDYAEMETKLGNDMFSRLHHKDKLYPSSNTDSFMKNVKNEYGNLRKEAI